MNITIFNSDYTMRRYAPDGSFQESSVSIHLHPSENGSGSPWSETQGIVRNISGHGMVPLREADLEAGTKADRILYKGRWYECTSSVFYDRTMLAHYNYQFIVVPEDAITTITIFNPVFDPETGFDVYKPTVIRGASWLAPRTSTQDNIGIKAQDKYTIRVPEDADFSGSSYVDPAQFVGEQGTFTFRVGDIIVKGEESGPSTIAALQKKYGFVVKVMAVNDFRTSPNARHWRLDGE